MTSIISFFVLLLITYSYAVPVEKVHDSSTVPYDFTTDKTMVDHGLIHGEQSTGTPNIHKKRIGPVDPADPVDIPPRQTMEEQPIYQESFRIPDVNRRPEPPIQDVNRRPEPLIQDVNRRPEPPIQDVNQRPEPPMQGRPTDDEELLPAQDINRRREPPIQGRSTGDEELLITQDIDRRREPPMQERSTDDEKLLTQDIHRRRVPPVQGGLIDNEELLPAQHIDRRREQSLKERSIDEHDSDEITTTDVYRPSRTFEESSISSTTDVYRPSRTFEESSISSTTDVYRPLRTFDESSIPSTTIRSTTDVYRPLRTFEDSSISSTTIRSTVDYSSTPEENDKRSLKDELSVRALESTTEFDRRAIRPIITETNSELKEEIQLLTRHLSENNIEMTTDIRSSSEPLSSIDSFGKITGLLHDSSEEVSTTTRSSFVPKNVQQLSQGQKQPVVETKKSN